MSGVGFERLRDMKDDFDKAMLVLETCDAPDKTLMVTKDEFLARQKKVAGELAKVGIPVGFVFSDENYAGDVPYLGGNINCAVEQCGGAIGNGGFVISAGLEGGYVAEQLAGRAGAKVRKVQMFQLADEEYPVEATRLEDVLAEAAGSKKIDKIGLLSPRQVVPAAVVNFLEKLVGKENVVDVQEIYYRTKYEKSDMEMALTRDACKISDAMVRAMAAVARPGVLESQLAAWGAFVGHELGAEGWGFPIIAGTGEANRTLIGRALNRVIQEGDWVHVGAGPKRDGLSSCCRRSFIAVDDPSKVTDDQKYWFNLVEGGYRAGYEAFVKAAQKGFPAKVVEQALVDYFASYSDEVSARIGRRVELEKQKPYTGVHNSGYTEAQEFYGAITLHSEQPLGHQIVNMLDLALRGVCNYWDDVIIPGFDFMVVENTFGKFGTRVECFNKVPINIQHLVGKAE